MGDPEIERRAQIARIDFCDRLKPKLCQSPSEIAGSFRPLRPQRL